MAFKFDVLVVALFLLGMYGGTAIAKPAVGGCGCGGGFEYGGSFGGGYGGYPCAQPSAPISFLPVPQPVPIRIPQPPKQSVTIPNIILALLPPNQKPSLPRPVYRPPPVVLPLPQPYPLPVPVECNTGCGC